MGTPSYPRHGRRVDIEALKRCHPIYEVVGGYGVELRRQGRVAAGRCPLHADRGRPNLFVWTDTQSWWCFRCNVGGDVIRFIELAENVSFLEAVGRLAGGGPRDVAPEHLAPPAQPTRSFEDHDADELATLHAATALYHHRLLADPPALAYLGQRGIDRAAIQGSRIGYAAGDQLVAYLRWRRMALEPALRIGLLNHTGREFLAGRIVVPEIRDGQPVWLVGRILEHAPTTDGDVQEAPPKYLALRGSKPLLGARLAGESSTVIVVEGVFDLLTLRKWGYPALALVGTHTRSDLVAQLRCFQRVYLVLDQDEAGFEATLKLADALAPAAVPVALPEGVKDVAELSPRSDGQAIFARALLEAAGISEPDS